MVTQLALWCFVMIDPKIFDNLSPLIAKICFFFAVIAMLCLQSIVIIMTWNTLARNLDLLYLMIADEYLYLALIGCVGSGSFMINAQNANVIIDFATDHLKPHTRLMIDTLWTALTGVAFFYLGYHIEKESWVRAMFNEVTLNLQWPTTYLQLPLAYFLMACGITSCWMALSELVRFYRTQQQLKPKTNLLEKKKNYRFFSDSE